MLGAFVALDLFLFFVFWELMLDPDDPHDRHLGRRREDQGRLQVLPLHDDRQHADAGRDPVPRRRRTRSSRATSPSTTSRSRSVVVPGTLRRGSCFLGFFLAFAIKVPMWPFHTWLPDAHVQAPTGRLDHPGRGAPEARHLRLHPLLHGHVRGPGLEERARRSRGFAILGGIIYGALVAWKQDDVKRLVAYSSVAHMGFVMLGLFGANRPGIEGCHPADGEPRHLDRRALPPRRRHLRPPPHASGARVRRARQGDADLRGDLRHRHDVEHRRARHERLRRRVHDPDGHVHVSEMLGKQCAGQGTGWRCRDVRRHPRGGLHAARRAEDVLRARSRTRRTAGSTT